MPLKAWPEPVGQVMGETIALGMLGWWVIGIVFIAFLLVTFFIEANKDNKLQDWLSRCHFGLGSEKYDSAELQVEQYKLALG